MYLIRERLFYGTSALLGAMPFLAVLLLAGFLAYNGMAAFDQVGLAGVAGTVWRPYSALFGMLPLLAGTLSTTLLALLLCLPLGLGASLYLALYCGVRRRRLADAAIALLGGLPSVVVGLWGVTWIVPLFGHSLVSATLVLSLMILPTFTMLAGAALRQVPAELVETVRALGVSERVVATTSMRHAGGGLVAAATLAASRGLGEAVALSMVAGNVPRMPSLEGPIATLTTILITEHEGAAGLHHSVLFLTALVVLALIAATSALSRYTKARPL